MNRGLSPRVTLAVLFPCFFLSGAAALIYEVVWMRMLTQVFGSSAYAVATVLAAFMAGLAVGSYVFGRLIDREKNSLRLYGILELGIGIYGFLVPLVFQFARRIYIPLFWLYDSYPTIFNLFLFALSFVLLVFPTLLMGATLPVLSRFAVRSFSHFGRRVADLYGTNTLGAVLGCGLAGYAFIPGMGMTRTLYAAAIGNVAIAGVILLLDRMRREETPGSQPPEAPLEESPANPAPHLSARLLLPAIALSGMAAMIYENAWTHALTLVIGGSTYSFTTMLLTFLTGLALGGYLYARLLGAREVNVAFFGLLELGVGMTALATIPLFEKLPLLFLRLHQGFGDPFALFLATQILVASAVMFLPTLLLGMTFPLVARLFTRSLYRVGSSVGTIYASNTLGAIAGAFAGGFILIPLVGTQQTILSGVLVNLLVGWLLLVADPYPGRTRRILTGTLAAAALVLVALHFPFWDRAILTSGVTIYARTYQSLPRDSLRLEEMRKDKILYYREGLTATVSVHQPRKDYRYLKTNGKIDGSHGDALTMLMTGYLPMILYPEAEHAAIIGLGTGMTAKAVGNFPVKKIDIIEIEPAMVEAAAFFGDKNRKILQDPRVRVIPTDGRNYMMAAPYLYDLIISEPSNPWIAGVAGLFTKEFYAVAKGKLKPRAVFAQWIHAYSMSPDDFLMVLRTFAESFPYVSVWNMQESDFLLIGSLRDLSFDYPRLKKIFAENKALRDDFEELGLSDVYSVLGFYRLGKKDLLALTKGVKVNTDDSAELEFSAPRSLGKSTSELNRTLMEPFLTDPPWKFGTPWVQLDKHHFYIGQAFQAAGWRERALSETQMAIRLDPRNADYHLLRARILLAQDKPSQAAEAAEQVLAYGPEKVKDVLALAEDFYTSQAKVLYLRIAGINSKEIIPYLGVGIIELHRKELSEATRWIEIAVKIQPDHPAVLLALGRLELAKGNYARAATLLENSQAKGEDSATLYGALGQSYSRLKQWDKAAQAYETALRHQRRQTEWRLSWARALAQLGRVTEAEERYREVLALNPDSTEAWQGLSGLNKRY